MAPLRKDRSDTLFSVQMFWEGQEARKGKSAGRQNQDLDHYPSTVLQRVSGCKQGERENDRSLLTDNQPLRSLSL